MPNAKDPKNRGVKRERLRLGKNTEYFHFAGGRKQLYDVVVSVYTDPVSDDRCTYHAGFFWRSGVTEHAAGTLPLKQRKDVLCLGLLTSLVATLNKCDEEKKVKPAVLVLLPSESLVGAINDLKVDVFRAATVCNEAPVISAISRLSRRGLSFDADLLTPQLKERHISLRQQSCSPVRKLKHGKSQSKGNRSR